MIESGDGSGQFEVVTLCPIVTISADSDAEVALKLHADAAKLCFIARSVNFRVEHQPKVALEA